MKKLLLIALSLCMMLGTVAAFAVPSVAIEDGVNEVEVVAGSSFSWNDQSGDPDSQKVWRFGKGKSPDGLWQYLFYSPKRKVYGPMVYSSHGYYAWAKEPGVSGLGYARARDFGRNFHPGETADVVKCFTFPSGGTVTVDTVIARVTAWEEGTDTTPTSLTIFLDDRQVFPANGEYETIVSDVEQTYSFDIDVIANQRLYIHIGCIDGNMQGDAVIMSNFVTYTAVDERTYLESDSLSESDSLRGPDCVLTVDVSKTDTVPSNPTDGSSSSAEDSFSPLLYVIAAVILALLIAVTLFVFRKKKPDLNP